MEKENLFARFLNWFQVWKTGSKVFPDGSKIEWVDRETIKYTEGENTVNIWMDHVPFAFPGKMIIKHESLRFWEAKQSATKLEISKDKQKDIIRKIFLYYGRRVVVKK